VVTPATVLGGLSGAVFAAGLVLLVRLFVPGPPLLAPVWLVRVATAAWNGRSRGTRRRRRRRIVAAVAVTAGALTWLISGLPVLGLVAAAAVPGVPWLLAAGSVERRAIERVEAISEWTRRLRDVAGTGAGLQSAIISAAATAPPAVEEPACTLAARLQAGRPGREALLGFADQIDDAVCDQIVAALLLHIRDRGDKLGAVLGAIADAAAREVAARKEADAERSGARFSIRFMVGFTVVVGAAATLAGDYMAPYATGLGQLIMTGLAGGFVAVLAWVRALTSPAPTPRLLAPAGGRR
jgi:hypothetical protein